MADQKNYRLITRNLFTPHLITFIKPGVLLILSGAFIDF